MPPVDFLPILLYIVYGSCAPNVQRIVKESTGAAANTKANALQIII